MKDPRAMVAIILAISVLMFVLSGTLFRELLIAMDKPDIAPDPEIAAKWENLLSVIVGVLAGYVMGRNQDNGTP